MAKTCVFQVKRGKQLVDCGSPVLVIQGEEMDFCSYHVAAAESSDWFQEKISKDTDKVCAHPRCTNKAVPDTDYCFTHAHMADAD